jgi:hypothetical protein
MRSRGRFRLRSISRKFGADSSSSIGACSSGSASGVAWSDVSGMVVLGALVRGARFACATLRRLKRKAGSVVLSVVVMV